MLTSSVMKSLYMYCLFISCLVVVHTTEIMQDLHKMSSDSDMIAYQKKEHPERCKWYDIRSSIEGLATRNIPVLIQTSCFSSDSLGNDLSNYFEARLCAKEGGLHFISAPKTLNIDHSSHAFYSALSKIVVHSSPISNLRGIQEKMSRICPCSSMCHEWKYGLMHSRMETIGSLFRAAMDSYWKSANISNRYLDINTARCRIGRNGQVLDTTKSLPFSDRFGTIDVSRLPLIPDTSVHYRCGDNVVTHYGFTMFRTFRKSISSSSRYIYVMGENPGRKAKPQHVSRCNAIFESLLDYLMHHFPQAVVVILRGHDMFEDLARLTYANTTVCSVSTFCLWPAVASNTTAYFPLTRLIAKEDTTYSYGPHFHWLRDMSDRALLGVRAVHMSNNEVVKTLRSG